MARWSVSVFVMLALLCASLAAAGPCIECKVSKALERAH
jgi:hypothetical protein